MFVPVSYYEYGLDNNYVKKLFMKIRICAWRVSFHQLPSYAMKTTRYFTVAHSK